MIKLNNKGQSLVMFILILPIILLLIVLVVDIGSIMVKKQELDNVNQLTIEYGLDHISNQEIESKQVKYVNRKEHLL